MTKIEREKESGGKSSLSSVRYESVLKAFLQEDFTQVERLASQYAQRHRAEPDSHEVAYLRALSLMKMGRFEEARPTLSTVEQEAPSQELRQQAAYSLGDSYYFQNRRPEADSFYKEALRKYPEAGEAETVRRLLGLSHPVVRPMTALAQFGVEEIPLYTVQVGAFQRERNAQRLLNKLLRNRYDAYIDHEKKLERFRVRVGHLESKNAAASIEERLKKDGFPTKLFP